MEDEYGDEYALFVAEDSLLGQLWVDRQIPVINVSAIMDSCMEIHDPVLDGPFGIFFTEALLQTIYHELRHLFYECNELIETGSREYPADGSMEENVEEYADAQAAGDLVDFFTLISEKEVRHLKEGMTACRTIMQSFLFPAYAGKIREIPEPWKSVNFKKLFKTRR